MLDYIFPDNLGLAVSSLFLLFKIKDGAIDCKTFVLD